MEPEPKIVETKETGFEIRTEFGSPTPKSETKQEKAHRLAVAWVERGAREQQRKKENARAQELAEQLAQHAAIPIQSSEPTGVTITKGNNKRDASWTKKIQRWRKWRRYKNKECLQHPDAVLAVEDALQEHFTEIKTDYLYPTRPTAKIIEKRKKKLLADGYVVEPDPSDSKDAEYRTLRFSKTGPVTLNRADRKSLDALIGEIENPVDFLFALRALGIDVASYQFHEQTFKKSILPLARAIRGREGAVSRFFSKSPARLKYDPLGTYGDTDRMVWSLQEQTVQEVLDMDSEAQDTLIQDMKGVGKYGGTEKQKMLTFQALPATICYAKQREVADQVLEVVYGFPDTYNSEGKNSADAALCFDALLRVGMIERIQNAADAGLEWKGYSRLEVVGGILKAWNPNTGQWNEDGLRKVAEQINKDIETELTNPSTALIIKMMFQATGIREEVGQSERNYAAWKGYEVEFVGLVAAMRAAHVNVGDYTMERIGAKKLTDRQLAAIMDPAYIRFINYVRDVLHMDMRYEQTFAMYGERPRIHDVFNTPEERTALESPQAVELLALVDQPRTGVVDIELLSNFAAVAVIPNIVSTIRTLNRLSGQERQKIPTLLEHKSILQRIGSSPNLALLEDEQTFRAAQRAVAVFDTSEEVKPEYSAAPVLVHLLSYVERGGASEEFFTQEHISAIQEAQRLCREKKVRLIMDGGRTNTEWQIDSTKLRFLRTIIDVLGEGATIDIDDLDRVGEHPEAITLGHKRVTVECGYIYDGNIQMCEAVGLAEDWEEVKRLATLVLEQANQLKQQPEGVSAVFLECAGSAEHIERMIMVATQILGEAPRYMTTKMFQHLVELAPYHSTLRDFSESAKAHMREPRSEYFWHMTPDQVKELSQYSTEAIDRVLPHVAGWFDNKLMDTILRLLRLYATVDPAHLERMDQEIGVEWLAAQDYAPDWLRLFTPEGLSRAIQQKKFDCRRGTHSDPSRWGPKYGEVFDTIDSPEVMKVIQELEATGEYTFGYHDAGKVIGLAAHPERLTQLQQVREIYGWSVSSIMAQLEDNETFLDQALRYRRAAEFNTLLRELYLYPVVTAPNVREWDEIGIPSADIPTVVRFSQVLEYVSLDGIRALTEYVKDPAKKAALEQLVTHGITRIYDETIEHILQANPDELQYIIQSIHSIRDIDPRFRYEVKMLYGTISRETQQRDREVISDPYFAYWSQTPLKMERLQQLFKQERFTRTGLPREFTDGLMRVARSSDRSLDGTSIERVKIEEEKLEKFNRSVNQLRSLIETYKDQPVILEVLFSEPALSMLARQPDRIATLIDLPRDVPDLFPLVAPGGPLHSNKQGIAQTLFENGNISKRAREVTAVFRKRMPLWQTLFLYTNLRLGESLATSDSKFPLGDVTGLSLSTMRQHHLRAKADNPERATSLEYAVPDEETRERIIEGTQTDVQVHQLSGVCKRLVFRDMLRQTIEMSRDTALRYKADQRNRGLVREQLEFSQPTGIHGSYSVDVLPPMLLNGNLPKESLGERAETDSRPFHFDFFLIQNPEKTGAREGGEFRTMADVIEGTNIKPYFPDDGIALLYDRSDPRAYQYNREVPGTAQGRNHFMIFGGMPATEITGIVCRTEEQLPRIRHVIIEAGFYIPVYTVDGQLQFSAADYDGMMQEFNMDVPVEVWDSSLQTGRQQGSNTGGEYTVPSSEGPVRYYVKFGNATQAERVDDRLWNEQLADNLYREMGIAVPDTAIVRIGNSYGHASRILEQGSGLMTDFNDGFVVDAWLANWDIVFERNRAEHGGKTVRLDNGGSLLYRAHGERRTTFGPIVVELDTMRGSYEGLQDQEVQRQARELQERMTDEVIDRIVDGVRLPFAEREGLKQMLKDRRDFIAEQVIVGDEAEEPDDSELPIEATEVVNLLSQEVKDHTAITTHVREWGRFMGEEGFQHNGVLLGQHLVDAVDALRATPEFDGLTPKEQHLATIAVLFHDSGKPTGRRHQPVERDYAHEVPSIAIARTYMDQWGMSKADQRVVALAIQWDGVVSDIARGRVHDDSKNMTPDQLRKAMRANERAIRVLRAVNRADVVATVGTDRYDAISSAFESFFEDMSGGGA